MRHLDELRLSYVDQRFLNCVDRIVLKEKMINVERQKKTQARFLT